MQQHWIVFTDLDGTLLDTETYSFSAALPALQMLTSLDIPIILNSSKTIAELAELSKQLDLHTPIIAENGSIIFNPQTNKTINLGVDYSRICHLLDELREHDHLTFSGFHDWDVPTLQERTGLEAESARRAKQRQATEPLLWGDSAQNLSRFRATLASHQLKLIRGGRFWHVMGNTDKVLAMRRVQANFEQRSGKPLTSIALGDSPNDNEMLCAADIGILVKNPHSKGFYPSTTDQKYTPNIIETSKIGPAGWNETLLDLLRSTNGELQ